MDNTKTYKFSLFFCNEAIFLLEFPFRKKKVCMEWEFIKSIEVISLLAAIKLDFLFYEFSTKLN